MSRKHRILFFLAVVIVVAILFFLNWNFPQRRARVTNETIAAQKAKFKEKPVKSFSGLSNSISNPQKIETEMEKQYSPKLSDSDRQKILSNWQTPINCFGKVVDEKGTPIAEATVGFGWVEVPGFSGEGDRSASVKTDAEGNFSLVDKFGPTLSVSVGKDGYYAFNKGKASFNYREGSEKFIPNSLNPVVFILRKKGFGEALIEKNFPEGIGQIKQLPHDATLVSFPLLNQTETNESLNVKFFRQVSNQKQAKYDWKLDLS